jgi:hypothetical protein
MLGIYFPLWFGTGMHYAVESMYNPVLKRDPIEAFLYWWELNWNGGTVKPEEVKLGVDTRPKPTKDGRYVIQGLQELHPFPEDEEFEAHRLLGIGMLEYYKEYAKRNDNFDVVAVEHDFSVPLGFEMLDPRDGIRKEVHYRGRMDCIIYLHEEDRFAIIDHKTAASIEEEYFTKLVKDEQCTSYIWAAQEEARIFDLPYTRIEYVLYNVLRKAYPRPPTMLKSGTPSLNRTDESTTYEMFMECIKKNNLEIVFQGSEKMQLYAQYLQDLGDENFVVRKLVRRNRHEINSATWRIKAEAREMLSIPMGLGTPAEPNEALYPNFRGSRDCTQCLFRSPCLAFDDGSQWEYFIEDNYVKATDR